jgi:hypothetical protein
VSYIAQADLAQAESFRTRVKMATVQVAGTILNEDVSGFGQVQAMKRLDLAQRVLRDPDATVSGFVYPVVSNAAVAEAGLDAADQDFQFVVASVWDAVAGVSITDRTDPDA